MTDLHSNILHANGAAGQLLNITSKRLEGCELLLYSHNRDAWPHDDRHRDRRNAHRQLLVAGPPDELPDSVRAVRLT